MSSFKLDAEKIKRLLLERGWNMARLASACDFHPSTLTRAITKGDPASLETLLAIADKLEVKNHQSLVEGYIESNPIPITMTLAAPPELADILTPDQWEGILKYVVSSIAKFLTLGIERGSLLISLEGNDAAMYDLIASFLAWRLQYFGAYQLSFAAPHERKLDILNSVLSRFHFANDDMPRRFEHTFFLGHESTMATWDQHDNASGLHFILAHRSSTDPRYVRAAQASLGVSFDPETHGVWRLRSTLSPRHIAAAERFFANPRLETFSGHAHFSTNVGRMRAILLDDETFRNHPQHQFS